MPSSISVGVSLYTIVSKSVLIWKPSTSASVQKIIRFHLSKFISKVAKSLLAFDLTSTPQPRTFNKSVIMSLLKILFKSAFRQLSILPLIGIIAWKFGSLACLQAPKAESPSTMNNSLSELSLLLQSTNFATLFVISRELVKFFLILTLVFSASSLLLLLIRT